MVEGKVLDFGRVEEVRARLKPNLVIDLSFKPKVSLHIEENFQVHIFPRLTDAQSGRFKSPNE